MVPFKKILSQIMNGLHTNHFCGMGTIMKFVINMEVLDAEFERIEQISLFPARAVIPPPPTTHLSVGLFW